MGIRNKVTGEVYTITTYDSSTGAITGINNVGGNTDLGNVSNVYIGGGNPGEVLSTDGAGNLSWVAGSGGSTGNVTFDDVTIQGDDVRLNLSTGPDYTANLAYLQLRAGDFPSHIHLDTGNSEAYDLYIGNDQKYVQVSSTGNILMSSYDGGTTYQWNMDNTGILTIPGATYAPTSLNTIKGGYGFTLHPTHNTGGVGPELYISYNDGIEITPITNDYYAGGTRAAPLYIVGASTTETGKLPGTVNIQGGQNTTDNTYANVRISTGFNRWTFDTNGTLTLPPTSTASIEGTDGENVRIRANSASDPVSASLQNYDGSSTTTSISAKTDLVDIIADSNRWIFDNTGNLTIPGTSGGFIKTVANASIGIVAMDNGTDNPAQLISWNQTNGPTTIISAYAGNATIQTNVADAITTWQFLANGVTVFPGDLIGSGASPAPSINGFDSASFVGNVTSGNVTVSNSVTTTPTALGSLTAVAGGRAFVNDSNIVASGNFGNQVGNGGSNTVPVWSDGTNWYIG